MDKLLVRVSTLDIPAPYANTYQLEFSRRTDGTYHGRYQSIYLGREDLDREEIIAEGFSGDDDLVAEAALAENWTPVLQEFETRQPLQDHTTEQEFSQQEIHVEARTDKQVENQFTVYDDQELVYLVQELAQAILESAGKEAPLYLYFTIIEKKEKKQIEISISFAERQAYLTTGDLQLKPLGWDNARELLSLTYLHGYEVPPVKPNAGGLYISFDNREWLSIKAAEKEAELEGYHAKFLNFLLNL